MLPILAVLCVAGVLAKVIRRTPINTALEVLIPGTTLNDDTTSTGVDQ